MSNAHDNAHADHHHEEENFFSKYVFSMDHKMIAKQFLVLGLIMLLLGGGLVMLVRWQLAYPDKPLPIRRQAGA